MFAKHAMVLRHAASLASSLASGGACWMGLAHHGKGRDRDIPRRLDALVHLPGMSNSAHRACILGALENNSVLLFTTERVQER